MAPEKVTVMILDVDLKCSCCCKKVKKVLCKFPQIRDQVFDENKNKVRITVICCNPEKIRDKLCCKGGKAIQRIEIVEDKPKPVEKPKELEKPKPFDKPKEPEKSKPKEPENPKQLEKKPSGKGDKPKPDAKPPSVVVPMPVPVEKPRADPPKVDPPKPDPPRKPEPAPMPPVDPQPVPVLMPEPMHGYPPPVCPPAFPVSVCCPECYEGRGGGPCEYWYGRPAPPPPGPCYDGYGYQYGYGGNRGCYVSRCDYFSEENPQGCWIM